MTAPVAAVEAAQAVKPLARIWIVVGEGGQPEYCAGWPEACHEHINDAIEQDITEAARWVVREYVLP
jgi:hypothetical protein